MRIRLLLLTLLAGVLLWPGTLLAQSPLIVQCMDSEGVPITNALRDAIAQDTERPADRVYVLKRNDICYNADTMENSGFHLRIIGEAEPADEFPATIQMVEADGGTARMLRGVGDLTIKNVWISGQNTTGSTTSYHPIQFEGNGRRIVFDNVVFERNNFHIMGVTGANNKVYVTNSVYRNFINTTQQWEGRGIRFEAGADTLVMENNTFLNIGHTVVQSEARPIEYVRFVHNTVVNVGRTLNSGGIWKEAYFANNLVINPFWHGEFDGDFTETRATAFAGFFSVEELPPAFGTDLERAVLYANNAHWRDPAFQTWYDARNLIAQPLFNSVIRDGFPAARTTQDFFNTLDNFVARDNWWNDLNPGVVSYTQAPTVDLFPETSIPLSQLLPKMQQTMNTLRAGSTTPNWNDAWLWDPGRDPLEYDAGGFVWPLPEDLSYTNQTLRTGSVQGLPLGDLNWFPAAKATWEANRDVYVEAIEAMAQGAEVNLLTTIEAEDGIVAGNAEVMTVDGFTYFQMDGGGFIQWTFDLEEAEQYDLNFWTHMRNNSIRGQRVFVNGVSIKDPRNWGEYIWDTAEGPHAGMPINEWTWTRITQNELHADFAGVLTLPAGTNVIRIEPSWGWQNFAGLRIMEPGTEDVVLELLAPDAVTEIVAPRCAEEVEFCPSGFRDVAIGAGGSLTFNVELPHTGKYILRIFNDGEGSGRLLVDDVEVVATIAFDDSGDVLTEQFQANGGVRKITLESAAGGFSVDFVQVLSVGAPTSIEPNVLPHGFALHANYPNPFNPTTTIEFTVGLPSNVRVVVYDVMGRQVATLVDQSMATGRHQVTWDARNAAGQPVTSGVYFYRFETAVGHTTRKMVLVK
jgi:hypothetical protein